MTFEPNYLCHIQFDLPDFPWMFTPASAAQVSSSQGWRLRPWIALIVLKDGEEYCKTDSQPLPYITVSSPSTVLQDLSDSWAWAHTQISGDTPLSESMATVPGNVISRLLCPRRLDQATSYTAFLVPAFEIGRLAGLGNDVSQISTAPAWNPQSGSGLQLPVYYQFSFHTSEQGDFESLVRRLRPQKLTASVGQRSVDATQAVPSVTLTQPFQLSGALVGASGPRPDPWNRNDENKFKTAAQDWINQTDRLTDDPANPKAQDPVVVPPIYGRWYAEKHKVNRDGTWWLPDLNLNPWNRASAGMGVQIVQNQRSQLLASAWEQVGGVLDANQKLKQAQLSRSALQQIHQTRLGVASAESLMLITAPVNSRVFDGSLTVRGVIRTNHRVPERVFSGAFRRLTRPRIAGSSKAVTPSLLKGINNGDVKLVPVPKLPDGLVPIEQISASGIEDLEKKLIRLLGALASAFRMTSNPSRRLFLLFALAGVGLALGGVEVWELIEMLTGASKHLKGIAMGSFTEQAVADIPARRNFTLTIPGRAPVPMGSGGSDSAQAKAFRTATDDLFADFQSRPKDPRPEQSLNLSELKSTLLQGLDPTITVPAQIRAILLPARVSFNSQDELDPISAVPQFLQPMYVPLRDLSPSNLLPGVDQIPPDSVSLVVSNHAFIEAYMCGLNDEMTRLLMWDGYPLGTQQGTYFKQFWDVSACIPQRDDPSDIKPINEWDNNAPLGQNAPTSSGDNLVLLVRGDLFRRYPNSIVYMGKAKLDSSGNRVLDETDERYPLFRGTLPVDITFLGFDLSPAAACGKDSAAPQGYFLVFQEQPSQPRFGMEPTEPSSGATRWTEVGWTNFVANPSPALKSLILSNTKARGGLPAQKGSHVFSRPYAKAQLPAFLSPKTRPYRIQISPIATTPTVSWGVSAAQTASSLLRLPYRILIHVDLMLDCQNL
jgi:hypothetical protein